MAKFYIDFSGYCIIEAETKEEAEAKFWAGPDEYEFFNEVFEIDGIEEI